MGSGNLRVFISSLLLIIYSTIQAQEDLWEGPIDSTSTILLKNRYVQNESTLAMYDMYNFNFDRAERQFLYLKKQYGWHPLPYFLLGLNYWWRIVPDIDEKKWDKKFLAYMDTSLALSKKLYEEGDPTEGAFFLSATYSFQGRLYSERKQWTKAAFAGKQALNYLEECKGKEDFSPELLFGDALFNYYAIWIPENYPFLKPIMRFFPDGNKELGIEQLKNTARNSFYARTEAQYFLMRILQDENKDYAGAMQVAEYLYKTYPNNAYFHRYYTRLLYQTGRYSEAEKESKLIIERIDLGENGYEYNSGRYAAFFLGHINSIFKKYEEAKKYFGYAIEYGKLADATDMGYYLYAHIHLARIAILEEEWKTAEKHLLVVKKSTKKDEAPGEEARKKLTELKKSGKI